MNLYILNYNNYYNRRFKKLETLQEYYEKGNVVHELFGCRDFTPNDAVNTEHIFGSAANSYDGSGDYFIVTDENNNILSRWFIIDTQFTRQGQWKLTLRRDLVADYYDIIIEADCFIEKAIVPDFNPLVYNSEQMTLNQIKTSETLLKDKTDCAWVVGYYNRKPQEEGAKLLELKEEDNIFIETYYDAVIDDTFEHWYGDGKRYAKASSPKWTIAGHYYNIITNYDALYTFDKNSASLERVSATGSSYGTSHYDGWNTLKPAEEVKNAFDMDRLVELSNSFISAMPEIEYEELLNLNGKRVKFTGGGQDFYCNISINAKPETTVTKPITSSGEATLFNYMKQVVADNNIWKGNPNQKSFTMTYSSMIYEITYTVVNSNQLTLAVDGTKFKLDDAGYNMFALPYPETDITMKWGEETVEWNKDLTMLVATSLGNKYAGGGVLYDLQLLPYCPCKWVEKDPDGYLYLGTDIRGVTPIKNLDSETIGFMLHAPTSQFTIDIPLKLECENIKMENQTDMYRLCSPNFNGQFEFNLAQNGGSVDYINVDCTYIPYSPYIHMNPNFSGLYGQDFDDARGLICGGDYSLPMMNDAWQTYQLQNKNYQAMFDREVKNMKVQNNVGLAQDIVGALVGTAQGIVGGMATSSFMGGVQKTGGIIGGILSGIGGAADIALNSILRAEALDYKKDMFGYQLGNIQALPQSIAKTTAYTNNNKIFPILEYYTCTDVEKRAFAQKIAYNSMTVGMIDRIQNYTGNSWSWGDIKSKGYIKGSIIYIPDLEDKFTLLKNISDEIYKGVYFLWE